MFCSLLEEMKQLTAHAADQLDNRKKGGCGQDTLHTYVVPHYPCWQTEACTYMYQRDPRGEARYQEAKYKPKQFLPNEYFEDSLLILRAYQRPTDFPSVH
jgi:hypothetical protein